MSEAFLERDFKAYERHRQDDPEYNALRLSVRRKLKAIADRVKKEAKALGTDMGAQAGLHHPYTFNSYRVKEQRAYLCRGAKERKKLASFFGEALGKDADLYKALLQPTATKELRMRFCRDVDAEDVVEAFEESLEPRILARRKAAEGTKESKLEDLNTFRKFFSLDELKEGNELRFTWHADGTLCTVVNGERKPDLKSQDLAWALFDVYLGNDPISDDGKRDLVARIPGLLGE